jgi:hypothetical protein
MWGGGWSGGPVGHPGCPADPQSVPRNLENEPAVQLGIRQVEGDWSEPKKSTSSRKRRSIAPTYTAAQAAT